MHTKKNLVQGLLIAATIMLMAMPVWAGNGQGKSSGKGSGTRTQNRIRERSGQEAIEQNAMKQNLAAHPVLLLMGDRVQQQLQDETCLDG
jgi:hypothetical protein